MLNLNNFIEIQEPYKLTKFKSLLSGTHIFCQPSHSD